MNKMLSKAFPAIFPSKTSQYIVILEMRMLQMKLPLHRIWVAIGDDLFLQMTNVFARPSRVTAFLLHICCVFSYGKQRLS